VVAASHAKARLVYLVREDRIDFLQTRYHY
jgi:Txe/YoeB family toxin of Txe-Axe toxin-antitoxin module